MKLRALKIIVLLATLSIGILGLSTTSAFASAGCTSVNGFSSWIALGSVSQSGVFAAGDKIHVDITAAAGVAWQVHYYYPPNSLHSGVQSGSGSYDITVPVSGNGSVEIQGYDAMTTVPYAVTCTPAPVASSDVVVQEAAPAAAPAPDTWNGSPNSIAGNYDGRINATRADRYAVYCKADELQVWDGVNGVKVGAMRYADIAELANPASVSIGDHVFLGHSNNELAVVIPGSFEKFGIALDRCISGGYEVGR